MKRTLRFLLVAAAATWCCAASAKESARRDADDDTRPWLPLGLSIIAPPVQLPSPSHTLFGAVVNLGYGQMTDVCLFDVGLVNNVTRNMGGVQAGPVNIAGNLYGVQGGIVNYAEDPHGLQLGLVNIAGHLHGLQLGIINVNLTGMPVFPIFNIGF